MDEITACVGRKDAGSALRALLRGERRGATAGGIAVQTEGRILETGELRIPLRGSLAAAATRHQPGVCCEGELAVIHAGEIRNSGVLRGWLSAKGHVFRSESPSEVLAHLLEECWVPPLQLAVSRLLPLLRGRFGLIAFCVGEPGRLVAAHRRAPLLVGIGEDESYVASEAAALVPLTRRVVNLEDDEIAVVDADGCDVLAPRRMTRAPREISRLSVDPDGPRPGDAAGDRDLSTRTDSSPAPTG